VIDEIFEDEKVQKFLKEKTKTTSVDSLKNGVDKKMINVVGDVIEVNPIYITPVSDRQININTPYGVRSASERDLANIQCAVKILSDPKAISIVMGARGGVISGEQAIEITTCRRVLFDERLKYNLIERNRSAKKLMEIIRESGLILPDRAYNINLGYDDPVRILIKRDGTREIVELYKAWEWDWNAEKFENRPHKEWIKYRGRILQMNANGGILVVLNYIGNTGSTQRLLSSSLAKKGQTVFLTGYPRSNIDETDFGFYAIEDGVHVYESNSGTRTVMKLNYGEHPTKQEMNQAVAAFRKR
jgi:hypothetical protein